MHEIKNRNQKGKDRWIQLQKNSQKTCHQLKILQTELKDKLVERQALNKKLISLVCKRRINEKKSKNPKEVERKTHQ